MIALLTQTPNRLHPRCMRCGGQLPSRQGQLPFRSHKPPHAPCPIPKSRREFMLTDIILSKNRHTNTQPFYPACSSMPGPSLSAYSSAGCTCVRNTGTVNWPYVPSSQRSGTEKKLHDDLVYLLQGVAVCIGGLGMLVGSDKITEKDYPALDRAKGDIFMIVGATLYGFSM